MKLQIKVGDRVRFRTDGEWAYKQMQSNKTVCHDLFTGKSGLVTFWMQGNRIMSSSIGCGEDNIESSFEMNFLEYYEGTTGWQIYEPVSPETPSAETQTDLSVAGETQRPKFEVGGYIMDSSERCFIVLSDHTCKSLKKDSVYPICEHDVPVTASQVVIDIGNGVKGWIKANGKHNIDVFSTGNCWLACVSIAMLTEPMQSVVKALLARQIKESGK
ncbi:MAG: hypothetical protein Q8M92_09020 [Candidatus Subteraquimicrobiales bacterium]|nr:hypothetical protein [Candidatus Subteraquimicrobiales bacterium]